MQSLHEAVAECDHLRVEALLAAGARLSAADAKGRTVLHAAVDRLAQAVDEEEERERSQITGRIELIHSLLRHEADVNARDSRGRTPMHIAVTAGLHSTVQGLIDAGADPTLESMGKSTLRQATTRGDSQMVRLVLEASTARACQTGQQAHLRFVNREGRDGWTALSLAARGGHVAAAEALLSSGADPTVVTNGKTALDLAMLNKRESMVALLRQHINKELGPARSSCS